MLDTETELRKLAVPVKTRHNEVAPGQYEIAPIFENSNVGSDHQQLTMQIMQNVARNYGLVCLLHEKPFAGVNGSGKHNNWSMGTDTGDQPDGPGRHPGRQPQLPVLLHRRDPGGQQAPGAAARVDREHRPGPPPGRQRGPAGDHLGLPRRRARQGIRGDRLRRGRPAHPGLVPRARGLGAAAAADARRRPQPDLAVRLHGQQVRVPGRSGRASRWPSRTPSSTRSSPRRSTTWRDKLAVKVDGGGDLADAVAEVVRDSYTQNKQIVFGGDNYDEAWHAEAEKRGLKNLRTTPDALPEILAEPSVEAFEHYEVLSERELESRYEVWVEQYITSANIEAETADGDRQDDDPAGRAALPGADRRLRGQRARRRGPPAGRPSCAPRSRRSTRPTTTPTGSRGSSSRDTRATASSRRWPACARRRQAREGRRRRPLAAAEVLRDPLRALSASAE